MCNMYNFSISIWFLYYFHAKLPLTRPKSPKLGRRKSCNDAVSSSSPVIIEKGSKVSAWARHSIGTYMETSSSPKSKSQAGGRSSNARAKVIAVPCDDIVEEEEASGAGLAVGLWNVCYFL